MTVDTSELTRLAHDLRAEASGPEFRAKAEAAVGRVVADLHDRSVAAAPVDTGALRSSIKAVHRSGSLTGSVGSSLKQGFFQEFGTAEMPPQPWLLAFSAESRRQLWDLLGEAVWRG